MSFEFIPVESFNSRLREEATFGSTSTPAGAITFQLTPP